MPGSCDGSLRSRVEKQNVLLKRLPAKAGPLASKGKGLPEQGVEAGIGTQNVRQALPQQRGHSLKRPARVKPIFPLQRGLA